ncbi:ATP-binding protein [Lewinella sp. 4G2]|uniref:ATP-binding protein n=1 Tax=Lewinella sp. 4G2 TaxID=1803372 RepID=UPI0007DFAF0D|nr:ATP-binding protein [Lewinella sp. 4G2]OAV44027.1 hypothetical protein A3850_005740 [Lewinella sp. 4G2]
MFYNRTQEIERLTRALARERKQFIVLYGRRRCGKSTLLRKFLGAKDVYYLASQSEQTLQLAAFRQLLAERIPAFAHANFTDWNALLHFLNSQVTERFTLVIDEFPYLVRAAPDLPSIIQRLVDDRAKLKFDIILCGSSQQMMQGLVLSGTAPLYGRADEVLKIDPLAAGWLLDHLPGQTADQLITEFSTWGGVPRYWELRSDYPDYDSAVAELVLSPDGVLRNEPARLLLDDLRDPTGALSLLYLIANGVHRPSELGARLNKPATDLSRPLKKLIDLGYVERESPFKAKSKHRKGNLYKVKDSFIRFYFQYVQPNLSNLQVDNSARLWQQLKVNLPLFVSHEFERMARVAVTQGELGKDFFFTQRWWGKGKNGKPMEIDLVGESLDKTKLLVGECKWSTVKAPDTLNADLLSKATQLPFYHGQELIPVLIAKNFAHPPKCFHLGAEEVLTLLRK